MMLDPDQRSLYTEALAPPPEMVFDEAVATTFSLDPLSLLTIPVYLCLQGASSREVMADGVAVLEALRRVAARITVYMEPGRIYVPARDNVLYALLEEMVVGVRCPAAARGGVFHAKMWLLRFRCTSSAGAAAYRLLILSRNLTADNSWDLSLRLDGTLGGRNNPQNEELADLISRLPAMAPRGTVSDARKEQARRLASECRHVNWDLPPGVRALSISVFGLGGRRWNPVPSDRLAVISPFCTPGALRAMVSSTADSVLLVSRPETMAALGAEVRRLFSACRVLHERAENDDGEAAWDGAPSSAPAVGLHAKAYLYERGPDLSVCVGSMNATDAAALAGNNVEILAELRGGKRQLAGIRHIFDPANRDGIGSFLVDFQGDDEVPEDAEALERERVREHLERCRALLAASGCRVRCRRASHSSGWELELRGSPIDHQHVSAARAWPISVPEQSARDALPLFRQGIVELGEYAAASVTGLVAFEIAGTLPEVCLRFVLNLPLDGRPPERDAEVLRTVIRNRDGFFRYLMFLLSSIDAGAHGAWLFRNRPGMRLGTPGPGRATASILEELVRAYCRSPERLSEIDDLMRTLAGGPDTADVVPEEFRKLWQVFRQAMEHGHETG